MIASCTFHTPIAESYFRNNRSTRQKSLRCFPLCSSRGHVNGGFCGQSIRTTMVLKPGPPSDTTEASSPLEAPEGEVKEGHINATAIPIPPSRSKAEESDNDSNNDTTYTNPATSSLDINDFIIILEIRPLDNPRISKQKFVKKQEILNQLRTKHEKSSLEKELFMGEIDVLSATSSNGNNNTFNISSSSFSSNALASSVASTLTELKLYVTFNSNHSSWDYSWKSNRWLGPNEYHVIDIIVLKYYNPTEFQVYSNFVSTPFIVVSSHKKSNIGITPSISDDPFMPVPNHNTNDEKELTMKVNENNGIANILIMSGEVDAPIESSSKKKSKKGPKPSTTRKRSASAISKANTTLTSSSYGEDMTEVMEGAQLLSNLFGKVITLPTKPAVVEEEDDIGANSSIPSPKTLPAPAAVNSSSSPRHAAKVSDTSADRNAPIQLPSSALSSSALEVAFPAPLSPQTPIPIPVPMPAYPSKKVAIVHDRHARSYEVHYPALTLIEEVRGTYTINGGKRRRVRKNHPQIPSSGGLSGSGKEESDGELQMTSNQAKFRASNVYRNHRQLPDKDPQGQYNTSMSNDMSIEDSANQLLMLASKDHLIDTQQEPSSSIDYRAAATAASTNFEEEEDEDEEPVNKRKTTTKQTNITSKRKYTSKKLQSSKLQPSTLTISSALGSDGRYFLATNDNSSDEYSEDENTAGHTLSTINYPSRSNNSRVPPSSYLELCLPDKDYNQKIDTSGYRNVEDQVHFPSNKNKEKSIASDSLTSGKDHTKKTKSDDAEILLLPKRVTSV